MIEDVTARLASFNYLMDGADGWILNFIIEKIENEIMTECNSDEVPVGLQGVAVDMVVGEFLLGKKAMGQLTGFDLEAAVKQVQEGDTTITFAFGSGSKTPEQRLDTLIAYLMSHGRNQFPAFRSIGW